MIYASDYNTQVQSNWDESDSSDISYIQNKPLVLLASILSRLSTLENEVAGVDAALAAIIGGSDS